MKQRILLIDDDQGLIVVTKEMLVDGGYRVATAGTAEEALRAIQTNPPDLIISDINLPGLSGLKLCEILKGDSRTDTLPLILLTQLGGENDKVRGLKTGADDYLTKPFSHKELLARVEALIRRTRYAGVVARRLEHKNLLVDLDARVITLNGKSLDLRRKEYELLVLLLQNKGRLVTKEFITEALWKGESIVTSNTLSVHLKNLREQLGPYRDCIETLVGEGYRFKSV